MKYYLAIIQNPSLSGEVKSFTDYVNYDDAMALYHTELAYRGEERLATTCTVFDEMGTSIATEAWVRSNILDNETYYLAIVQNQGPDEADVIYKYVGYDAALAVFHRELGYREVDRNSTKVAIIASDLHQLRSEQWVRQD